MSDQRRHIAVHMRAGLGDAAVLSTKLKGIREAHPGAVIRCYLNSPSPQVTRVLLDGSPYLDEVVSVSYSRPLAAETADAIGAWSSDGTFYNLDVFCDGACRPLDHVHAEIPFDPYPAIVLPGSAERWAAGQEADWRRGGNSLVGFHLHGVDGRPALDDPHRYKEWGQARWQRLADLLGAAGPCRIVLVGGPGDDWDTPAGPHIVNLIGRSTIAQTLALVRRLDRLVGIDSGLKSCGLVLGVPTLMLWDARWKNANPKECWFPAYYQALEENAILPITASADEVFEQIERRAPAGLGSRAEQ
jgi:ADP-heptose:LPS heptosyltransferase